MNKQHVIKKQQFRFMLYNLIAFSIIFAIFGLIVFTQMKTTLYAKTDAELLSTKNMFTSNYLNGNQPSAPPPNKGTYLAPPPDNKPMNRFNPRIIPIKWNANGEIVNIDEIGELFYENFNGLLFDINTLNVITNIKINNTYHFRTITLENPNKNKDISYIQLLVNVDAEQNMIDNFQSIIILCSIVFILLSISASFILSRKTMKPIISSWNKQAEFVENASHELRTPLTIVQNKLEFLLTTPDKKIVDKFEHIALSLSELRRLTKLTKDLLTLARADSAETQLVKQPFDLDEFISTVCLPYMEIAELQNKQIWLKLSSGIIIDADKNRIHQLLVILLDNAIKYTGENDSIGIITAIQDNRIIIKVSDTGVGIGKENLGHIFDRFYREDKARTRENGGAGLGLSIAQWIVNSHHGTIVAIPNEPKGSIFIIKLPK